MRGVCLSDRVVAILGELLRDVPVLVNSLNFNKGSQQAFHVDSLYMTPATVGNLVATWIALEDCHPDAGPLTYFPESHQIVPFQFSNGSYHFTPSEMDAWRDYVFGEVDKRGLESEVFPAKRGDLFIWSANLLHGGSPICNPGRLGDAYWYRRPPQEVPVPETAGVPRSLAKAALRGARRLVPGRA